MYSFSLQKLLLQNNQLNEIEDNIRRLTNLNVLNISQYNKIIYSNKISNLPCGLGDLNKLKVLNVSYNNLSSFPVNELTYLYLFIVLEKIWKI